MKPLIDRLKHRCRIEPATGCWVWTQGSTGNGYPQISLSAICSTPIQVRRLVYVMQVGQISRGSVVVSTCGENGCINPAHLKLMTRKALATRTINQVNKRLTPESRRKAKIGHSEAWHPPALTTSRINGVGYGGNFKRQQTPELAVTSASAGGLSSAAETGTETQWPSCSDGSCGPTSGQGQGE